MAASSLLGPVLLDVIHYRTSESGLNQLKGADLASLALVAPTAAAAGVLWLRDHRLAPVASLAPAAYAAYLYTQASVGQEYALYEGNAERFFPLYLGLVVLGGAIAFRSWARIARDGGTELPRRLRRATGVTLIASATFLVLGLHLPGLVAVWRGEPGAEYREIPTAFWIVKLMDLGIIVPAALVAGGALLRGGRAGATAAHALAGGFTLIGASVTAMALVMLRNDDPSAAPALAVGFGAITAAFGWLTWALARSYLDGGGEEQRPTGGDAGRGPTWIAEQGRAP